MMQCDDVAFAEILVLEYSLLGESTKKHVATSANFGECDHTQTECDLGHPHKQKMSGVHG